MDIQAFDAETRDIRQKMLAKILLAIDHYTLKCRHEMWSFLMTGIKAKDLRWLWLRPVCSSCGSWAECPQPCPCLWPHCDSWPRPWPWLVSASILAAMSSFDPMCLASFSLKASSLSILYFSISSWLASVFCSSSSSHRSPFLQLFSQRSEVVGYPGSGLPFYIKTISCKSESSNISWYIR